jgi:hypothetical protein
MPLLDWFTRKKPVEDLEPASGHDHDGDATLSRKEERSARRELLYTVVRECMIKASVLSSHYRFKVLSLDKRGRRALLMIDLDGPMTGGAAQLTQIERAITEMAKARHGLSVKAVYWRQLGGAAPVPTLATRASAPVAASASVADKAADKPTDRGAEKAAVKAIDMVVDKATATGKAAAAGRSGYEPIDADEVAAFRQALAEGTAPRQAVRAFDGHAVHGPQSYTLLTGFEDTEMRDERHGAPLDAGNQR